MSDIALPLGFARTRTGNGEYHAEQVEAEKQAQRRLTKEWVAAERQASAAGAIQPSGEAAAIARLPAASNVRLLRFIDPVAREHRTAANTRHQLSETDQK